MFSNEIDRRFLVKVWIKNIVRELSNINKNLRNPKIQKNYIMFKLCYIYI